MLLMLVAATASFLSSNYQYVYAATKNTTNTNTTPSPIGSKTFMTVITKVTGGTKKPSDFTISVAGKSPSPKSFSGSSSGTSVTLNAGKYKVTSSGPTGYSPTYSSRCSGTASGGTPINRTISFSFSTPTPSPSGGNRTSEPIPPGFGKMRVHISDRANCHIFPCPGLGNALIKLYDETRGGSTLLWPQPGTCHNGYDCLVLFPVGDKFRITAAGLTLYVLPAPRQAQNFQYEESQFQIPPDSGKICGIGQHWPRATECVGTCRQMALAKNLPSRFR